MTEAYAIYWPTTPHLAPSRCDVIIDLIDAALTANEQVMAPVTAPVEAPAVTTKVRVRATRAHAAAVAATRAAADAVTTMRAERDADLAAGHLAWEDDLLVVTARVVSLPCDHLSHNHPQF